MRADPSADFSRWQGKRVTVAVPDGTRPFDPLHVDRLLRRLEPYAEHIDVIVSLGLHRRMSDDELAPLRAATHPHRLTQHDPNHAAADPLHPLVTSADVVICMGVVEPHQYAGFSGGVKTVAIGCANAAAIAESHRLGLLGDPRMRIGAVDDNPFQDALWRRVSGLKEVWAFQVSTSGAVFFGPARSAFDDAVRDARSTCFEPCDRSYQWVHLRVPDVKAQSFYQASRVATYVALVDRPVIEPGGWLIVEAACPEGMGTGAGEISFETALHRGLDVLLDELKAGDRKLVGGEQRAYVLAMVLERFRIVLVGAPPMPALGAVGIRQVDSIDEVERPEGEGRTFDDVFRRVPRLAG